MFRRIGLAVSAAAICAQPAAGACVVSKTLPFDKATTVQAITIPSYSGVVLHYKAAQNLDGDGAATAYSVDPANPDALESICVGANAYTAPGVLISGVLAGPERAAMAKTHTKAELQKIGHDRCVALTAAYNQALAKQFDQTVFPKMDFYAIATPSGKRVDKPCAPIDGFYVSTTSKAADPSAGVCTREHWLDPTRFASVVLPRDSLFTKDYRVAPGTLALAMYGGKASPAIVGDMGPPYGLGEMSYRLAWNLRGETVGDTSTPAQIKAASRRASLTGPVSYFVFTNSSVANPLNRLSSPDKPMKVSPDAIDRAFSAMKLEQVQRDLGACAL